MTTPNVVNLFQTKLTADDVLEKAKGKCEEVVIIGFDEDNNFMMYSSKEMTLGDLNLILDITKHKLVRGDFNDVD